MESKQIEEATIIHAPVSKVWSRLIDMDSWWEGMTFKPKKDSEFEEVWYEDGVKKVTSGKVLNIVPLREIVLSWKDSGWHDYTKVEFFLKEQDINKTHVRVLHSGWEALSDELTQATIDQHKKGWGYHLIQLKKASEQ